MRQKLLQLGLGLFMASAVQAQSPWQGSALPAEGGTFYLYQVETGKWLQNNQDNPNYWTTRAELGKYGIDIEIIAQDGGYRLNPKFGHNHSINSPGIGDNPAFYLDTDQPQTVWSITPIEGKTNVYTISADDGQHFLNANDEGWIDDFGFNQEWQLITYEQRLEEMKTATKENPKDATWLIGGHDFANQDERNKWDVVQEGDGNAVQGGDGIVHANRCWECWKKTKFVLSRTYTGLPNGTYEFQLQGFYRDGSESGIAAKRESGTEEIRASYFINDVSRLFKSILDSEVTEYDQESYAIPYNGIYYPGNSDGHQGETWGNAHNRASNCFFKGGYLNDPVKVVVSDGTLTIGMQKIGGGDDDWLLFDNFKLTYLGEEIDLGPIKENLQNAINEATAYEGITVAVLTNALSAAQALLEGTDAVAIANATMTLRNALAAAQDYSNVMDEARKFDGTMTDFYSLAIQTAEAAAQESDVEAFDKAVKDLRNALNDVRNVQDPLKFIAATIPFAEAAGVDAAIIQKAQGLLEHCDSAFRINNALNELRVARKIQAADKHADVFAGAEPADEADFYIYNVGQKRFLCGGGDWGAHAFVGFPGVKVTLVMGSETPENSDPFSGYMIDTHLNNGGESEYLNYGGYMDTPTKSLWEFVPVEGKSGVYAIARANGETNADTGERMLLGWRPGTYGNVDTDMYGVNDPNNQWKLVTEAERDALLATATVDNPQDASYKIASPNFNQREDVSLWASAYANGTVWGRGDNHPDFAYECWNESDFDLSQTIYGLNPGWYQISLQGYYREGDHENQIRSASQGNPLMQTAVLADMFTGEEVALPNILSEVNKAPGFGNRGTTRYLVQKTDEAGEPVYDEATAEPVMIEDPEGEALYVGEFPKYVNEACDYFQNGLYKVGMLTEVGAGGDLMILIQKISDEPIERDWVVLDNFRLTYYGANKPSDEIVGVKEIATAAEQTSTAKIYNLQGQLVKNVTKGLYIRGGKKFVRK